MTWWPVATLLTCALVGCGLTLDLEPPDQRPDAALDSGVSDFGVPKDEGPVGSDGFRPPEDLGTERDLSMSEPDAGLDGGPPDLGTPRTCEEGCLDTEYCQSTLRVCLDNVGICVRRPTASDCAAMEADSVCGCDYRTYRNECAAAAAGVSVAIVNECPDFGDVTDWCDLVAPPQTVTGCVPCYDDADCIERTTTAFECVGSTCSSDGVGRCAFNLPNGRCYYDRDCDSGERCEGAIRYGCNDPSGLVPVQGTCR